MSDDEVRAAAERHSLCNYDHRRSIATVHAVGQPHCQRDGDPWPCDIQTVASYALEAGQEVARLRAGIAVSNAFVEWALPMLEYAERSVPPVLEIRITVKPWIRAVRELRDGIAVARAALETGQEVERLRDELHACHAREALQWSKTAPEMEDCPRCAALSTPGEPDGRLWGGHG